MRPNSGIAPRALVLALLCTISPVARSSASTLQSTLNPPAWMELSGSFRARLEGLQNQFRPDLPADDHQLNLRTTLRAQAHHGRVTALVEVFDARSPIDRDGGLRSTGSVNALEPVQALLRFALGSGAARAWRGDLSLGRFTVDVGSRRLVGRNNFRNTTNAFTGALLETTTPAGKSLTALIAAPQQRRPSAADAIERDLVQLDRESFDRILWVFYLGGLHAPGSFDMEPYLIGLHERDARVFSTADRQLITAGLRMRRAPTGSSLDLETEFALQFGERRPDSSTNEAPLLDVFAWTAHMSVRYRPATLPRWHGEVGVNAASGDRNPDDDDFGRFDNLFGPRRGDWGPTGIFGPLGRANIWAPYLRVDGSTGDRWSYLVRHQFTWLDRSRDTFASTGVVDPDGASGLYAGQQIEARTRCWLVRDRARVEFGLAQLWAGEFLREAPNSPAHGNPLYGHVDLEIWF